jgi:DNA-binding response OmpR family regulator
MSQGVILIQILGYFALEKKVCGMALSILVVDDDQDVSLMLKDRLTFLGFYVTTANNGAEAMSMLKTLIVDGILLDIQMPVMNGMTMLEQLREQDAKMPVIVMTAEQNKQKLIQAMELGASDYLVKPIDVDLLAKKCFTLFG